MLNENKSKLLRKTIHFSSTRAGTDKIFKDAQKNKRWSLEHFSFRGHVEKVKEILFWFFSKGRLGSVL